MTIKPTLILCAALAPSLAAATTLQALFGGGCLSGPGGASACNWQQEFDLSDVTVDFSAINVAFEPRNGGLGLVPTISYEFAPRLFVTNGDGIWFGFNYSLSVPGGVQASELELTGVEITGAGGFIQVTDSIFSDNQLVADLVAEIDPVFGTNENPVSVVLGGSYTSLWVEKEIRLQADVNGVVALGDLHQSYAAPEPTTVALFAGGLVGAVAARRRRSRNAAKD